MVFYMVRDATVFDESREIDVGESAFQVLQYIRQIIAGGRDVADKVSSLAVQQMHGQTFPVKKTPSIV